MKTKKVNLIQYLILLILITVLVSGISLARFIISQAGSDSANVTPNIISLNLEKNSEIITVSLEDMIPGDIKAYDLIVTNSDGSNTSLVSFKFYIEITITSNLPLEISLEENWVDGLTFEFDELEEKIQSNSYNVYSGTLKELYFIFHIVWDEEINSPSYESLSDDINIQVFWEQIT